MHRAIQPFGPPGAEVPARGVLPTAAAAPPKGLPEYLRALRRRWWLATLVGLLVIVPGTVYVLRRPDVYRAFASIRIEPPSFDGRIKAIIPHGSVGQADREADDRYVPNHVSELRGLWLAEKVVARPELHIPPASADGVAREIVAGLSTRRHPDSNNFDVFLEGKDPVRTAALLNALLDEFLQRARGDSFDVIEKSKQHATTSIQKIDGELKQLDGRIAALLEKNPAIFAPGGKSLLQEQYVQFNSMLMQKRMRHDDLREEQLLGAFGGGRLTIPHGPHPYRQQIDQLLAMKEQLEETREQHRRIIRNYRDDPAPKYVKDRLAKVEAKLDELQRLDVSPGANLAEMLVAHSGEEIIQLQNQVRGLLGQMQATMPKYTEYLGLLREREQKEDSLAQMRERLAAFELLAKTLSDPVRIHLPAAVPEEPFKPNRPMYLALIAVLGVGLGAGLVCGLEALDARVKAPEHLSDGLRLPLLGVVPRMRRLAQLVRGGHLWTPGMPRSMGADAFRSLRASLLGVVGGAGRPVKSLLVTSAKAGEGKSTTALNLAATFARCGERTLLIDADLRRPSLADVFEADDSLGLVDVLRGDMPWPRALVPTGVPNLDFMPTGDPTDIPIEVLGTLELRQLLEAVSGHYHRVILDGPAVLGMADCRMLGRIVDGAVLVVRCGANDLNPLRRAKQMLELSRVRLAGVVFNDLDEDLANWSNEHPLTAEAARRAPARALEAEPAAASEGA